MCVVQLSLGDDLWKTLAVIAISDCRTSRKVPSAFPHMLGCFPWIIIIFKHQSTLSTMYGLRETSNSHSEVLLFKHWIHIIILHSKEIGTKIQMNQLKTTINYLPDISLQFCKSCLLPLEHVLCLHLLPISDTISKINIVFLFSGQEHPSQDFPYIPKKKKKKFIIMVTTVTVIVTILTLKIISAKDNVY